MAVATGGASALFDSGQLDGRVFSGGWKEVAGRLPVDEPATGEVLAEVGNASRDDVFEAAKHAADAQRDWAAMPGHERAAVLLAAADALEDHREEAERWIVREGGSIPPKAHHEVNIAQAELREAATL